MSVVESSISVSCWQVHLIAFETLVLSSSDISCWQLYLLFKALVLKRQKQQLTVTHLQDLSHQQHSCRLLTAFLTHVQGLGPRQWYMLTGSLAHLQLLSRQRHLLTVTHLHDLSHQQHRYKLLIASVTHLQLLSPQHTDLSCWQLHSLTFMTLVISNTDVSCWQFHSLTFKASTASRMYLHALNLYN